MCSWLGTVNKARAFCKGALQKPCSCSATCICSTDTHGKSLPGRLEKELLGEEDRTHLRLCHRKDEEKVRERWARERGSHACRTWGELGWLKKNKNNKKTCLLSFPAKSVTVFRWQISYSAKPIKPSLRQNAGE